MIEVVNSFIGGLTVVGLGLGSPVEWSVHKYLLHASHSMREKSSFIENASRGHNDNHHGAYRGPAHYYRDITNEHEVIHFSKGDVGFIAAAAGGVGFAIDRAYSLVAEKPEITERDGAFIAGVVAGTMGYYATYEFIHHYMHVIGKRRLEINRVLGDVIQGGIEHRDGKLRFSKPLLDDICNAVEEGVDKPHRMRSQSEIIIRLGNQFEENANAQNPPHLIVAPKDAYRVYGHVADILTQQEQSYRETLSTPGMIKYKLERALQRALRTSPTFQYLDNHHFVHHKYFGKNLNVVFPLMDHLAGSEEPCSIKVLEENRSLWLCPNSPANEKFKRKKDKERV